MVRPCQVDHRNLATSPYIVLFSQSILWHAKQGVDCMASNPSSAVTMNNLIKICKMKKV